MTNETGKTESVHHSYASFAHHRHQIAIAQLVTQVPTNAPHHDLAVKMSTFEQLFGRYQSWHSSIIVEVQPVCT